MYLFNIYKLCPKSTDSSHKLYPSTHNALIQNRLFLYIKSIGEHNVQQYTSAKWNV